MKRGSSLSLSVSRLIRVRCALATGLRIEVRAGFRPDRPRSTCEPPANRTDDLQASGAHAPLGDSGNGTAAVPFPSPLPLTTPFLPASTLARLQVAPACKNELFCRFKGTPFLQKKRKEEVESLSINNFLWRSIKRRDKSALPLFFDRF